MTIISTYITKSPYIENNNIAYLDKVKYNNLPNTSIDKYAIIDNNSYKIYPNTINSIEGILIYNDKLIHTFDTVTIVTENISNAANIKVKFLQVVNTNYILSKDIELILQNYSKLIWNGCTIIQDGYNILVTHIDNILLDNNTLSVDFTFAKLNKSTNIIITPPNNNNNIISSVTYLIKPILYVDITYENNNNIYVINNLLKLRIIENINNFNRGSIFKLKYFSDIIKVTIVDFNSYDSNPAIYTINKDDDIIINILTVSPKLIIMNDNEACECDALFTVIKAEPGVYYYTDIINELIDGISKRIEVNQFISDTYKIYINNKIVYFKFTKVINNTHIDNNNITKQAYIFKNFVFNSTIQNVFIVKNYTKYKFESIDFHIEKNIENINNFIEYDTFSDLFSIKSLLCSENKYIDIKNIKDYAFSYKTFIIKYTSHNFINYTNIEADKEIGYITSDTKINLHITDDSIMCKSDLNDSNDKIIIDLQKDIYTKMNDLGLAGMDSVIKIIIKDVLISKTKFMTNNLKKIIKPSKGIILYGPPGTGKTTLARNIANLLGCTSNRLIMKTATEIFNKYVGNSEKNIRELFVPAKDAFKKYGENSPLYIIILDEIDAIISKRGSDSESKTCDSVVNQFLGEFDGLNQINNLIVIGITNRLDIIDVAALRPGRFGCKIHIALPNISERIKIFELYILRLKNENIFDDVFINNINIHLSSFAKLTDQFSGADIENIIIQAVNIVINEHLNNNKIVINEIDIYNIISNTILIK